MLSISRMRQTETARRTDREKSHGIYAAHCTATRGNNP